MAESVGARLTSAGKELLAKAVAGKKLEFTKGAIGDAMIQGTAVTPTAEQQENYTSLIHQRLTTEISSMSTSGTTAKITISVDNSDVTSGFQIAEIGLFAKDPDTNAETLYCYVYAGTQGDVLPASDGVPKTFTYEIQTLISNATNVTAQISTVDVPIATKDSPGIVRVGKGLAITDAGLLSCTVEGGSTTTSKFDDKVTLSNGLQAQSASSDFRYATLNCGHGNITITSASIKGDALVTGDISLTGSPVFQGSPSTNKVSFNGRTIFNSQPTLYSGLVAKGSDSLPQEFDIRNNNIIMKDCKASVAGATLVGTGSNNPYMHFSGDDIYIDAGGTLSADSKALKFTGKTLAVTNEDCTVSISGGVRGTKVTPMYRTSAFDATNPSTAPSEVGTPISGTFFLAQSSEEDTHARELIFVGYDSNYTYSFKIADVRLSYKNLG